MLSSISPVGESGRGQRWWRTASAYVVASTAAGALLGAVLGLLGRALGAGRLPPAGGLLLLGLTAGLGIAVDRLGRVPGPRRQVDDRWLDTYRGWVYGAGFGAQLGVGVATIVPSSVVWVLWTAAALLADPGAGAVAGMAFGLLRAAPLLATSTVRTPPDLRRLLGRMDAVRRPVARLVPIAQGGVALAALARAVVLAARSGG